MPGTGSRSTSRVTKALRKATSGRGSIVIITVSSTSLTSPCRVSAATTRSCAVVSAPSVLSGPSTSSRAVAQPGGRSAGSRTST